MQNNNQLLPKIISLVGIFFIIGLPINNHFKLSLFGISLIYISYGHYRNSININILIKSVVCLLMALFIKSNLPQLNILETHNVFLLDQQNINNIDFYRHNLPSQVFKYFSEQFNDNYLISANCDVSQPNCWKASVPTNQHSFNAFAADSVWQPKSDNSRSVATINISNRYDAKIGTFNDIKYNFFDPPVNNIYRENMPFFIIYKIPKELLGMKLYWQGDVLWPSAASDNSTTYQLMPHRSLLPKKISDADLEKNIYISGIKNIESPIKIYLEKTIFYRLLELSEKILTIISIFIILNIFFDLNKNKFFLIIAAILFQLLNMFFFAKPLLSGMPILVGGGDGLVFYGYARLMLQNFISGNYLEVLRGLEDSFYYMPGLRYLRLIELILFGDTFYGYLLFLLFIPIIVFNFLRSILPLKLSLILIGLFFIPWLKYFGFANIAYIKFVLTGYSETLAYGLFLLSSTMIIKLFNNHSFFIKKFFVANFLLAIAVFLRPNLIIGSTILIFWGTWQLRSKLSVWQIIVTLSGFSPILFMLWHNIYYANEFAVFTGKKSFYINLITPPATYWHAICEIFNGKLGSAAHNVQQQLHLWNRAVYFFRIPAILTAIYCLISKKTSSQIRLIALLGITMQLQLLFFNAKIRYAGLAWFFCFITMIYFLVHIMKGCDNEQYKKTESSCYNKWI